MMRSRPPVILISVLLTVWLGACATPPPQPAVFDFGPLPPAAAAASTVRLNLLDVSAPPWLAGPGIAYRLDYRDPHRREFYRDSRWAAPPAELLEERLRQRVAGQGVQVRVALEEFSQTFSSPTQSMVLLRARAVVGDGGPSRSFEISRPAPSADAAGAVRGLSAAADGLVDEVLVWAAELPR